MRETVENVPLEEKLLDVIKTLNSTVWNDKALKEKVDSWLNNFSDDKLDHNVEKQKLNALYLLTQFMFFGDREVRSALRYIYTHLFKYPIIRSIRKINNNSFDLDLLNCQFMHIIKRTRFVGMGSASSSGAYLQYAFRQESQLIPKNFIHQVELFKKIEYKHDGNMVERKEIADLSVTHYVFIDDVSLSGSQAQRDMEADIVLIKQLKPDVKLYYFAIFGTPESKFLIQKLGFDQVKFVFELDDTFKAFHETSRFFFDDKQNDVDSGVLFKEIDKVYCEGISSFYGGKLQEEYCENHGYSDGQLLIGLEHNTPNNTLPIFWSSSKKWEPIFPRKNKKYKY